VDAVHARGATVAAHGTGLANCRLAAESAVDTLEHGFTIDADVARLLAENRVTVVSTLSVLRSWQGFATTTTVDRFTTGDGVKRTAELRETAEASIKAAHAADVPIAAGSDFGGGSVRAGHLAWEVECLVDAGLEPWEALGAATWRGGDVLGDARAGRIAVGDPAHFTVVHGDPLTEPAALWRVWHVQ
jgi:imidazolonepropionase-like amidohydrolase